MRRPNIQRVVIRPTASIIVAALSSSVAFFLTAAIGMGLLGLNTNAVAWSLLGLGTFAIFAVSLARIRCVISNEGVEIGNLWRTHVVPWRMFDRIEVAEAWLGGAFFLSLFSPIRVVATDGRRIIVQASLVNADEVSQAIRRGQRQ